jgi:hypothetical protein
MKSLTARKVHQGQVSKPIKPRVGMIASIAYAEA